MASLFMFDNTINISGTCAIHDTRNGREANYLTVISSSRDEFSPFGHMLVALLVGIVMALKQH